MSGVVIVSSAKMISSNFLVNTISPGKETPDFLLLFRIDRMLLRRKNKQAKVVEDRKVGSAGHQHNLTPACLKRSEMFGWNQNPTSVTCQSWSRRKMAKKPTATALLRQFLSPSARMTHFLFLCLFFSPTLHLLIQLPKIVHREVYKNMNKFN